MTKFQQGRYVSTNEAIWRMFFQHSWHISSYCSTCDSFREWSTSIFHVRKCFIWHFRHPETEHWKVISIFARRTNLLYAEVPTYYRWTHDKWQRRKQGERVDGFIGATHWGVFTQYITQSVKNATIFEHSFSSEVLSHFKILKPSTEWHVQHILKPVIYSVSWRMTNTGNKMMLRSVERLLMRENCCCISILWQHVGRFKPSLADNTLTPLCPTRWRTKLLIKLRIML